VRIVCETILQRAMRSPVRRQIHWVIDEARAFDAWRFIESGVRALRGANISLHLFYQNIGQLRAVWGEAWSALTDVKLTRFLGSNDIETLKWIAELAGETSVVEYGRSDSHTQTKGTSDAVGESEGFSLAKGKTSGRSWGLSRQLSQAASKSEARMSGDSWNAQQGASTTDSYSTNEGRSFGSSHSINRGWSVQTSVSSSDSHGSGLTFADRSNSLSLSGSHSDQVSTSYGQSGGFSLGWQSSHTFGSGQSRALGQTSSQSTGGSRGLTKTDGRTTTTGHGSTEGASSGDSETRTDNRGETRTRTQNRSDAEGRTLNYTQKRRLLTVDEVRRMDPTKTLLFIGRTPDCLVERMHYHQTLPFMERVLAGRAAREDRRQDDDAE
jgi:hypothetical protein